VNDMKTLFIFIETNNSASDYHIYNLKPYCNWIYDYKSFLPRSQKIVETIIVKMVDLEASHKHMHRQLDKIHYNECNEWSWKHGNIW
jgi:hypothetical protein